MGTRLPRHGCHRFSPLRFQERSLPGPPFGKPYCSAHSDASFPTSRFPLRCRSISASAGAFPSRRLRRFARRSSHAANDMRFPSGLPAPALTAGARCVSPDSKNRDSSPRAPGFRLPRTVRASRPKPLRVCRPAPCRRVDVRFFSAAQRPSQATAICAPRRHPRCPCLSIGPKADFSAPASWGVASVPPGLSARCGLTSCSPETQSRQGTVPSGTTRSISPEAGDVKTRRGVNNPQIIHTDIHIEPVPTEKRKRGERPSGQKARPVCRSSFRLPIFLGIATEEPSQRRASRRHEVAQR